jgi:hypothetical protein
MDRAFENDKNTLLTGLKKTSLLATILIAREERFI